MKRRPASGFTLLEVLIATAVLLACTILLSDLAYLGKSHAKDAEDLAAAQLICQTRLNEMLAGAKPIRATSGERPPELPGWILSVQVEPLKKSGLVAVKIIVKEDPSADELGTIEEVVGADEFGATDELDVVDEFSAMDEFTVESPDVPDIQGGLEEGAVKQFMLVHWMADPSRSRRRAASPDEPNGLFVPSSSPSDSPPGGLDSSFPAIPFPEPF